MLPLEVLYERRGLPGFDLPAELSNLYGGPLGFAEPRVFANFVTTLDGVVAVPGVVQANRLISGDIEADRFVMVSSGPARTWFSSGRARCTGPLAPGGRRGTPIRALCPPLPSCAPGGSNHRNRGSPS